MPWRGLTISGLIAVVPVIFLLNNAYVGWHDARYLKRVEGLTIGQSTQLKEQIKVAQTTADRTKDKVDKITNSVDALQLDLAVTALYSLKGELERHERNPESTVLWHREHERLKADVERQEKYVDCLQASGRNCEVFRTR